MTPAATAPAPAAAAAATKPPAVQPRRRRRGSPTKSSGAHQPLVAYSTGRNEAENLRLDVLAEAGWRWHRRAVLSQAVDMKRDGLTDLFVRLCWCFARR